ncbi:MAG: hypothetical protein HY817_05150 [Candidatus Abawacabacteria bacterium]|nr:hypothetical protein [Candidatus Abawacabacteria bacterium]
MKCSFCGTENMSGRTHCIACGTPLPVSAEPAPMQAEPANMSQSQEPAMVMPVDDPVISQTETSDTLIPAPLEVPTPPNFTQEPAYTAAATQSEMAVSQSASILEPESTSTNYEPLPAAESEPEPVNNVPESINVLEPAPVEPTPVAVEQGTPRVNVQFDDKDLAEVSMPIHQELPAKELHPDSATNIAGAEEGGEHTGPWLALTVLGVGFAIVCLVIYLIYRWFFVSAPMPTVVTPLPTVVQTIVRPTPSVVPLSSNDAQRAQDVNDLRVALKAYYDSKGRYPGASNYTSLLNSLIGSSLLTRRIQDPAFPAQEYKYTVDATGQSYEIVITFDSLASPLLAGSSSPIYRLSGAQGN